MITSIFQTSSVGSITDISLLQGKTCTGAHTCQVAELILSASKSRGPNVLTFTKPLKFKGHRAIAKTYSCTTKPSVPVNLLRQRSRTVQDLFQ